jgi:hypothetical protein
MSDKPGTAFDSSAIRAAGSQTQREHKALREALEAFIEKAAPVTVSRESLKEATPKKGS